MMRVFMLLVLLGMQFACAGTMKPSPTPSMAGSDARHEPQLQVLPFPTVECGNAEGLAMAMPKLAQQTLQSYTEAELPRYLENLARLQLVAEDHPGALETLASLRGIASEVSARASAERVALEIHSSSRSKEPLTQAGFDEVYGHTFREHFKRLDRLAAMELTLYFETPGARLERSLCDALTRSVVDDGIPLEKAVPLLRTYAAYRVHADSQPLLSALIAAEDDRRYTLADDVLITTPNGTTLSAIVARDRASDEPQPTALLFTIYADMALARRKAITAAAYGYAGVVAFSRGKHLSPDEIRPYEHEAEDTHAVIDWIIRQPWSDGQVGMYGGSYEGFSAWAATKALHPALKTIVPYVAAIPGQGLPMENNVFLNANYGWAFYVANNRHLDQTVYSDGQRWQSLNENWYASGRPYREIDQLDETANPHLQRWLQHPAYDAYWQSMVPYRADFAHIDIPVLSITGYYDDGQISALHYLKEHFRWNPNADHYLLIGPYDHFGAQARQKSAILRGYTVDPVAQFDTQEITFKWLDHVLRGGERPALIQDRINYQVMGANTWRHAPSLSAMSNDTLRLHLTAEIADDHYRLAQEKPARAAALEQVVDFSDRSTSSTGYYPSPIIDRHAGFSSGYSFISEPFDQPIIISGTFSGTLRVTINKRDLDVNVILFEMLPNGTLFHLSYYLGRASFAHDMSVRNLLTPGHIESIPFERTRMVSRQLQPGSRLLVTVDVSKNNFHQINHGTGRDVSDESIQDSGNPLTVQWYNDSYVDIPIWR